MDTPAGSAVRLETATRTFESPSRSGARRGPLRRAGGGLAAFLLGGLTTIEVIAVAVAAVATTALLWATGTVAPERLVTEPAFRAAWILLVLVVLRPITWVPYILSFVGFRVAIDTMAPGWRAGLRHLLAHVATLAVLGGAVWLVVSVVAGSGTAILSGLAFSTGSGSFDTLGSFRGDWTDGRIALVVAVVLLGRVLLPPLGRDLDLSREPVLGFAEGARGTFDRYLVGVVGAAAVAVGVTAYLIGRS
jgi:hypothetical protein